MNNRLQSLVLAMLLLFVMPVQAQQAITFAGGDISGDAGHVSFSCGEIATGNSVAKAITVIHITEFFTEGVQQGFVTNRTLTSAPLSCQMKVYPNPAVEHVVLECEGDAYRLIYKLFDIKGRLLQQGSLDNGNAELGLAGLAAGTYLLYVENPEMKEKNIYKIIKKD